MHILDILNWHLFSCMSPLVRSWCSLTAMRISCASVSPSSPPCHSRVVSPQPTSARTLPVLCQSLTPRNYVGSCWMGPWRWGQNDFRRGVILKICSPSLASFLLFLASESGFAIKDHQCLKRLICYISRSIYHRVTGARPVTSLSFVRNTS